MGFTRRDLLKFTGGTAAGLAFTPAPWALLRDTAVLSENWPGVPQPAAGEIHTRYTTCTLCPAGCGVRARCVGERVVSLAGVPEHPSGRGALCPLGLAGHHLAFSSDRATRPVSIERVTAEVSRAIAACGPRESVAILDPRPGRVASQVYQRFLSGLANGVHCTTRKAQPFGSFGIDLENTRAILSFGEPVLDGWLSPGRVFTKRTQFELIQVEAAYSRTASLADLWVPLLPGSEDAFADAVARALAGEPADAKAAEVARILSRNKPAIAIGSAAGVAWLNELLGSVGRAGGFLPRRDYAPVAEFAKLPDASVRVLLIEEGAAEAPFSWDQVQRKLVPQGAVVVALTPWLDGYARYADYVVPAPVYLESLDEAPTPVGSTAASFSLSTPLITASHAAVHPADFVLRLSRDSNNYSDVLKQRVAEIAQERRGQIFSYADAKSTAVKEVASADELWKAMLAGATWLDDPVRGRLEADPVEAAPAPQVQPTAEYPLILVSADGPPSHGSPLMSKLYRESGLRRPANAALMHPSTGRNQSLADGCRAEVKSPAGTIAVQVIFDPAVMPGVIEIAGQAVTTASIRRA